MCGPHSLRWARDHTGCVIMESIPPEEALILLQRYYAELVSTSAKYLNELLPYLVSGEVITIEDKNTIKKFGDGPNDRAEYLLDNHVNRPLFGGIVKNFVKLLEVMHSIPACSKLAAELLKALKCDKPSKKPGIISRDTPKPIGHDTQVDDEASKNDQSGMINSA